MTDITERLRRLYVQDGTNYVQEAADLIECLRAERKALVNDVHSCHPNCSKAGCVNVRLQARVKMLEDALQGLFDVDMEYFLMGDGKDDQIEAIAAARAALGETK
jgi:hypothetical protein